MAYNSQSGKLGELKRKFANDDDFKNDPEAGGC